MAWIWITGQTCDVTSEAPPSRHVGFYSTHLNTVGALLFLLSLKNCVCSFLMKYFVFTQPAALCSYLPLRRWSNYSSRDLHLLASPSSFRLFHSSIFPLFSSQLCCFRSVERSCCVITTIIIISCVLSTDCSPSALLGQHIISPTLCVWTQQDTSNTNMAAFTANRKSFSADLLLLFDCSDGWMVSNPHLKD